ncbi:MAG: bifunctional riboflavin kinase/FAD synthetase [Calditrichaeota bacterium]|nr:MAG: bifunctional riboflavin kinase/FAD synthetase [Calditrichota bacterium]
MRTIVEIEKYTPGAPAAVTVGTFDGVHLGHQELLKRVIHWAREQGLMATVVTFDPHPKKVVGKDPQSLRVLTDLDEKLEVFSTFDLDQVVIIQFTREFARLSYEEFVDRYLVQRLQVKAMVVGYDHHFGRNREGGFEQLQSLGKRYGFQVEQLGPFTVDGEVVSSSRIRELLTRGEVDKVARFLGRPYRIRGTVVQGQGLGKQLGFPTANIQVNNPEKIIPVRGVYAVDVRVGGRLYKGMMNIGHRPTVNFVPLTLEVHLFNFRNSIYGETVDVFFKQFIRQETKFPSLEALKRQLEEDKKVCLNI